MSVTVYLQRKWLQVRSRRKIDFFIELKTLEIELQVCYIFICQHVFLLITPFCPVL